MTITGFYSDTDYYAFVNTLQSEGVPYKTKGVDVVIEEQDVPSWILKAVRYFEVEIK